MQLSPGEDRRQDRGNSSSRSTPQNHDNSPDKIGPEPPWEKQIPDGNSLPWTWFPLFFLLSYLGFFWNIIQDFGQDDREPGDRWGAMLPHLPSSLRLGGKWLTSPLPLPTGLPPVLLTHSSEVTFLQPKSYLLLTTSFTEDIVT